MYHICLIKSLIRSGFKFKYILKNVSENEHSFFTDSITIFLKYILYSHVNSSHTCKYYKQVFSWTFRFFLFSWIVSVLILLKLHLFLFYLIQRYFSPNATNVQYHYTGHFTQDTEIRVLLYWITSLVVMVQKLLNKLFYKNGSCLNFSYWCVVCIVL